jgi:hypothetical protein
MRRSVPRDEEDIPMADSKMETVPIADPVMIPIDGTPADEATDTEITELENPRIRAIATRMAREVEQRRRTTLRRSS